MMKVMMTLRALLVVAQLVNMVGGGESSENIEICFFRSIRIVIAKARTYTNCI